MNKINVAAAVIAKNGKILIMQRSKKMSFGSLWEFPGGKIEKDETPNQAIVREMFEETELIVSPIKILMKTTYVFGDKEIVITFIECQLKEESNNPKLKVHDDFMWIDIKEMLGIKFAPADVEFVKTIHNNNNI